LVDVTDRMLSEGWPSRSLVVVVVVVVVVE